MESPAKEALGIRVSGVRICGRARRCKTVKLRRYTLDASRAATVEQAQIVRAKVVEQTFFFSHTVWLEPYLGNEPRRTSNTNIASRQLSVGLIS
jgi:hypothetical protein